MNVVINKGLEETCNGVLHMSWKTRFEYKFNLKRTLMNTACSSDSRNLVQLGHEVLGLSPLWKRPCRGPNFCRCFFFRHWPLPTARLEGWEPRLHRLTWWSLRHWHGPCRPPRPSLGATLVVRRCWHWRYGSKIRALIKTQSSKTNRNHQVQPKKMKQ